MPVTRAIIPDPGTYYGLGREHGRRRPDGTPEIDVRGSFVDALAAALDEIREDVGAFLRQWWPLASAAGWSAATFGHDYYLTRNRHGAGYWDRAWPTLPGFPAADPATIDAGDELTAAAHVEGEAELEPDGAGRLAYRQ